MARQRQSEAIPVSDLSKCTHCHQESSHMWPSCWHCQQSLGCHRCGAGIITEVLCQYCLAWGTVDALMHHGPIANTQAQLFRRGHRQSLPLSAYPPSWQAAYRHSEANFQKSLTPPQTEQGTQVMALMFDILKKGESVDYEDLIIAAWNKTKDAA